MEDERNELQRIYERDGALRPTAVVKEAEDESSPLHGCFEWVDSTAAHKYRLVQARTLIRRVRVITVEGQPDPLIHVPSVNQAEGEYQPRSVVVAHPDLKARAMASALARLAQARAAVDELAEAYPHKRFVRARAHITKAEAEVLANV